MSTANAAHEAALLNRQGESFGIHGGM